MKLEDVPTNEQMDNMALGADARSALLHIGRSIGFGRAQQILGELWDAEHNCAPRGSMGVTIRGTELAVCLRGAVTAMEVLMELVTDIKLDKNLPGLPGLIERSKAALKEYES